MPDKPICPYYHKHEQVTVCCKRGEIQRYACFNNGLQMFIHMKKACELHYTACKKYRELEKL